MALDEAILRDVQAGCSPPAFRVYEWEPSAITVGYSQDAGAAIDLGKCRRDNVPVTRRLTGGRAVFHADEATYSVIGFVEDPAFGGKLMDTYRAISRALIGAFVQLGADARWSRGEPGANRYTLGENASPCFLSVSRYEITLGGRKLVGSAQRRMGKCFLQQGSILTGPGHERITDYLRNTGSGGETRATLLEKTADLASAMGKPVDKERLKQLIREYFARSAGVDLSIEEPSPDEIEYANTAAKERYGSEGWVMGHEK